MSYHSKFSNHVIKTSVGARGINAAADVALVQSLLNEQHNQPPVPYVSNSLDVDGKCGPMTIAAIEAFQSAVLKWGARSVDGRVDPGGKTWRALSGNVASATAIEPMALDWGTIAALQCSAGNAGARPQPEVKQPVAGAASTAAAGTGQASSYQKFSQLNYSKSVLGSRYGGDADQDGIQDKMKSIAYAGCALTSLTMAATRIGARNSHWPKGLLPKDLTPVKANEIVKKAGGFNSTYLLYMDAAAKALGMVPDQYGFGSVPMPKDAADKIIAHLMTDRPVAAHVDYKRDDGGKGDHWVLLTNMQGDGKVRAIDPSGGKFMTFTKTNTNSDRFKVTSKGCLFGEAGTGFGPKTTKNQPNYCVVRYILLSEVAGTSAAQ